MNEWMNDAAEYIRYVMSNLKQALKWSVFGILCGLVVGTVASLFAILIQKATGFRLTHPQIIFLLPLAGLLIVYLYHKGGSKAAGGTNLVLNNIRENKDVPKRLAPLIFSSTVITHLFGGSAGREGAALQLGSSMGSALGRLLHFNDEEMRRVVICGMSAAFSALFGTPLAACILPMEISTVGIIYYSALVPCAFSSLTAHYVAVAFGLTEGRMTSSLIFPAVGPKTILLSVLFAMLCSVIAVLFCTAMHKTEHLFSKYIQNEYVRIVISGCLIIILTLLVGEQTYNGTGSAVLAKALTPEGAGLIWCACLLKILFTAITLSGGFKGGEIVPTLFIGATLGNTFAYATGGTPNMYAALGMGAVFCGVTNCPISSLIISFELFGFEGTAYFLIVIAITYLLSGNYGIYHGQTIRYNKFEPGKVNRRTH